MSFNLLPNELIEKIALDLDYIDLCNLSQLNVRLNSYISDFNGLWQQAFAKQWPMSYEEVYEKKENKSEIDWKLKTKQYHLTGRNVYRELCQMSARHYDREELSDDSFDCIRYFDSKNRRYCAIEELMKIVESDDRKKYNLTIKYYAEKGLQSLQTELVRNKWTDMVRDLNYRQIEETQADDIPGDLITGSVLFAQYYQPNIKISESKIRQSIRDIALQAVKILQEECPENYILTHRGGELLTNFEASHLTESVMEPRHCLQAIHAINMVMYGGPVMFRRNSKDYYLPTNSFINKVLELKLGIPIILCILYQAVAALMGVKLYPISNPACFMLGIRMKPPPQEKFTFIDPYNKGILSDQPLYISPEMIDRNIKPSTPLSVFRRMALNLFEIGRMELHRCTNTIRNSIELSAFIEQEDPQLQLFLARMYLSMDINLQEVLPIANKYMSKGEATLIKHRVDKTNMRMAAGKPPVKAKYRKNSLRFAVGMVMRVVDSEDTCDDTHDRCDKHIPDTCVIFGWEEECTGNLAFVEKNTLTYGEKQPVYLVLLDNLIGSVGHVPQEHLEIAWDANTREIHHPQIGRYFTGFNGRYYELNEEMRLQYPEDERACDEIYRNQCN